MTERLMQYIWHCQHFSKKGLKLVNGDALEIIYPGIYNTNQGPDFLEAKIRIGKTLWMGSIELHVNEADWHKHAHQLDSNYSNVVLHVVWDYDPDHFHTALPVFSMQTRVPGLLLEYYEHLMNNRSFIPCGRQVTAAGELVWITWKERLLVERLQRKSAYIFDCLQQNQQHWEETFWWLLARNFGIKVNAEAFEAIARSLPVTILARHKNRLQQLEALLLGQAGLLSDKATGKYAAALKKDFLFYKNKYGLKDINYPVHFLRMRPSAFPTIRLAQLARLLHQSEHLFTSFREAVTLEDIKQMLAITAGDYWNQHYTFNNVSDNRPKKLGCQMINNIITNTVLPMIFAYGHYYGDDNYKDRALRWLDETAAESNAIIKGFAQLDIKCRSAFESQALIELRTSYCDHKKCLDCSLGNALLKKSLMPAG